jgi:hypothetical protein
MRMTLSPAQQAQAEALLEALRQTQAEREAAKAEE